MLATHPVFDPSPGINLFCQLFRPVGGGVSKYKMEIIINCI